MTGAPRRSRRATSELEVANWFFDNGLDGFVVIRDGLIERVNSRWSQILGWRPDQVSGRSFWDYVHPGDLDKVSAAISRLPDERSVACEHRALPASGPPMWIRSRVSSIAGQAAVVMIEDIARERAEAEIIEQAKRGSELVRAAAGVLTWRYDPDSLEYVLDPDLAGTGRWNVAGARSAERVQTAIHPDDRDRVMAAWEATLDTGEFCVAEYRDLLEGDGWRTVRSAWQGVRRKSSGRWLVEGVTQDITEVTEARDAALRSAEEAQSASRAKSGFLATMSHEIRTPLNGVLGMAQAMDADALSPKQRARLDVIRRSGETLLAILNDVLDLSKIEAGRFELESAEFDLGEVTGGAHAAFAAVAVRKALTFDLAIDPSAQGVYVGDPTRVRQVLYNLISNAVKFTERGGVDVRVDRSDGGLEVVVRDTGIGIPLDRIPMLFDKFVQVDTSMTRRYGGTGLGLAICYELVQLMGGVIEVESTPGSGSSFKVRLPLTKMAATSQAKVENLASLAAPTMRILAAEDNQVNQLVLHTLLSQFGLDPTIVGDGEQAVQAWEDNDWDVVLMDIQMPVMDGTTAVKLIREREAASGRRRTPIIALTANALAHQTAEYREAGMDAVVAKPIEIRKLIAALELAADLGELGASADHPAGEQAAISPGA